MNTMHARSTARRSRGLLALLAAAALAACSSPVKLNNAAAPVETRTGTTPGQTAAAPAASTTSPNANSSAVKPVDLTKADTMATSAAGRVVFFDFDSYVVKDEFRPTVEANAKALAADAKRKVSIEGHTDERGGREYNLALGQKRAEAVAKSLALLGAKDSQLEAVSFGKERPAVQGSDEVAWAKNRRAELSYR